jgi:hypothetical protein
MRLMYVRSKPEAKAHERASDEKVAAAMAQAAVAEVRGKEAEAKAEAARLEIAEAQESAAKATADAAKANLELAKLKTPRTLTKEAQDRITAKIKGFPEIFPDVSYDLWANSDSDSTALMDLIDQAVSSAKWQKKKATSGMLLGDSKAGPMVTTGVQIHVAQEISQGPLGLAEIALRDALIAEGIPAVAYADGTNITNFADRTRIHIVIGSKPLN